MNQTEYIGESAAVRAHRRRKDGVEYRLQMIPGSDGLLELVEQRPKPSRFAEWARAMQFTGWGF
jgi:hypothetical protein